MNYNDKMEILQKVFDSLLLEIKRGYTGKIILHFKKGEILSGNFEEICHYFTKDERKDIQNIK